MRGLTSTHFLKIEYFIYSVPSPSLQFLPSLSLPALCTFYNPLGSIGVAGMCEGTGLSIGAWAIYPGTNFGGKLIILLLQLSLPIAPQPEWGFVIPSPSRVRRPTGVSLCGSLNSDTATVSSCAQCVSVTRGLCCSPPSLWL